MTDRKIINSIIKGARILRSLLNGINRVSELSKELQLSKSTTHRLLKSLEMAGMVMQDPLTRRYYLGPLILELAAQPTIAHQNLTICAFDEMKRLRDVSRETVLLHIRNGVERLCLDELQSPERIKYTGGRGVSTPIYTGAAGKVLLSKLTDAELHVILDNLTFVPLTPHTITDKETLLAEVEKVREQGYATSYGERTPGSAAISVPISNYICPIALSILGPVNRFLPKMMTFLDDLKLSVDRISNRLKELTPKM